MANTCFVGMRYAIESQGINNVEKMCGLFFSKVKITGLLFDPSSWELIGNPCSPVVFFQEPL